MENMSKPAEISLRPFQVSDVDYFMEWAGDDDVANYCRWNTYTSKDEALRFLMKVITSHPWYRALCMEGHPIGSIFVMPGTGKDQREGEIGYALAAKQWGKGIATEAVKMAVLCVFKGVGTYLDRVEGFVDPENKASQRDIGEGWVY